MKKIVRSVPTQVEVIEIFHALKPVVEVIIPKNAEENEEGKCKYINGYDDHVMAEKLGFSVNSIKGIRHGQWGRLIDHPGRAEYPKFREIETMIGALVKRLDAQDNAYAALGNQHDELQHKYDLLVTAMHANKVMDCKHLRVGDPYAK